MKKPQLRIAHLYAGLMNLYGDRGNVRALQHRAVLRDIEVEVVSLDPGDRIEAGRWDLFFFGGGQDAEQLLIYEDLLANKGDALRREIEAGAACLAVCGGYQLLGRYYQAADGSRVDGLGIMDHYTEAGRGRLIGNILIEADPLFGGGSERFELVGFENHGGRTRLGPDSTPLGRVVAGCGNNGEDGTEGSVLRNCVGTYLHGPILPKNHRLTDWLLERALQRRDPAFELSPLDAAVEQRAFAEARALVVREQGRNFERFSG